jgi:hypothetical protein
MLRLIFALLITFSLQAKQFNSDVNYTVTSNLNSELYTQSANSGLLQLYSGQQQTNVLYYKFESKRTNKKIRISSKNMVYVYLNSALIAKKDTGKSFLLNLNSFKKDIKNQNTLTFWSDKNYKKDFILEEVVEFNTIENDLEKSTLYKPINLASNHKKNYFTLFFIVILGFIAILKPFIFNDSIFKKIISFKISEIQSKFSPLNWLFLVVLVVFSIVLALFIYNYPIVLTSEYSFSILNVIYLSGFIISVYIIKYIALLLFSIFILNNTDFAKGYYAEFMSLNFLFSIVLIGLVLLSMLSIGFLGNNLMYIINILFLVFFVLRTIRLLFYISNQYNYHLFQVFCYLCAFEIFPWVIFLNYISNK